NPCRNRFRTSHAFDCKHFAAAEKLTQRQTAAPLCKNCGGAKFPVERKGKNGFLFAPRQSQATCGAVSGKARVARTLLSACQSHPPAQGSQNPNRDRGVGSQLSKGAKGGAPALLYTNLDITATSWPGT